VTAEAPVAKARDAVAAAVAARVRAVKAARHAKARPAAAMSKDVAKAPSTGSRAAATEAAVATVTSAVSVENAASAENVVTVARASGRRGRTQASQHHPRVLKLCQERRTRLPSGHRARHAMAPIARIAVKAVARRVMVKYVSHASRVNPVNRVVKDASAVDAAGVAVTRRRRSAASRKALA
jgi:hypothetical protein